MKKGDVVTIQDTSYSKTVENGKMEWQRQLRYRLCTIIELDCVFPRTSTWDGENYNDTVIQDCETGKVIFIEERFLRPVAPTHKVMVDMIQDGSRLMYGKVIEISDKLYKEIKRGSQN